jgi:PAS domain S-box-containing protein
MSVRPEKARVMIVEDEVLIAADIAGRLESMGYTVVANVTTGEKALAQAELTRPDLVLMDIVLAGAMDGIQASEAIRDRLGDIPMIFLTAFADKERLKRARRIHPFGYLLKPFQERDLAVTMEMALYAAHADAEKQAAIQALRVSEDRFQLFMNHLPGAAWIKDADGKTVFGNDFFYQMANLTADEAAGQSYQEYLPEDIARQFREEDQIVLNEKRSLELEHTFPTPDGDTKWLTYKFPIEKDGKAVFVGGISLEITNRRLCDTVLRQTATPVHDLFHSAGVAMAVTEPDGQWVDVNSAFQTLIKRNSSNLDNINHLDIIHPEDRGALIEAVSDMVRGERNQMRLATRYVLPDDETVAVELMISPMNNDNGSVEALLTMAIPIENSSDQEG